jgi:uncharacterized membrane-anchored protein
MSTAITRIVTLVAGLLVLGAVNYAIYAKERVVREGEVVFLELAPVDPRSLMQGDYMALRFRLADEIEAARSSGSLDERARSVPISLDERRVATLGASEAPRFAFRIRNGAVWLGTNAYFFTEGTAPRYTAARYGEFRLESGTGEAVLVGLRGADLEPL